MPAELGETIYTPATPQNPPRVPWTRQEVEACERAGLWEGLHYELVEGELINKMGKRRPHYSATASVFKLLLRVFGEPLLFQETPIDVAPADRSTSHPEPDVIVLSRPLAHIPSEWPQPGDIALVLEVADTTLEYDLTVKAALYARAGIPEYWVVDLNAHRLVVHRQPAGSVYKSVVAFAEQERVASLAAPEREILVAELFIS